MLDELEKDIGHMQVSSQQFQLIGDRLLARYHEAAETVFMDGSTPWEIDEAMVEFGFDIGPYEAQDLIGIDVAFANRQRFMSAKEPGRRTIPLVGRMLELGKLGKKSGAGWYRYPGGGGKVEDPIVADLAIEESHFEQRERTDYSSVEIRERLLLALINEAYDILHEGFASSASDIDQASIQRCGFPSSKGGLIQYANTIGIETIIAELTVLAEEDPLVWSISPMLRSKKF